MPALKPSDLPNATFQVKKTSFGGGGFQVVALDDGGEFLGELRIAIPLGMGKCHGAYEVTRSWAELKGIGPLLYDIAMELAGKRGIMSDRRGVSYDALRVWTFYESRSDTKKKQLDNPWGLLTPTDKSDDCRQDSAGKNWVESPLSRVNYKNSTPVLDELRRLGMLSFPSGGKTAARLPEILGNCGPEIADKARGISFRRTRINPKNGLILYDVQGSKGETYKVRVKALRKGNTKALSKLNLQVSCSCPYFRWQGPEHWAKANQYLYGKPEGTASRPVAKDPKGKHWVCKHIYSILDSKRKMRFASVEPETVFEPMPEPFRVARRYAK